MTLYSDSALLVLNQTFIEQYYMSFYALNWQYTLYAIIFAYSKFDHGFGQVHTNSRGG